MASHLISITGLQNLPNLQNFNADWNALQTLDLSGLTNLTYVDVSDCDELGSTGLKTINVTGCTALQELRIDDNDFSGGFPDLSTCNSLYFFDADQVNIAGTLDLSNIPALEGCDLSGNGGLTNVVISHTQPIGSNGRSLNCADTTLTQQSIDNILWSLASGSVNGGAFYINGASQGWPSEYGVEAIRILNGRSWNFNSEQYSAPLELTSMYTSSVDACNALSSSNTTNPGGYIHKDTTIQVGNYLYDDFYLLTPKSDGWYGYTGNGLVYQVAGGNGYITSSASCV